MDESISERIGEWWTNGWVENQMNGVLVSFLPKSCVVVAAWMAQLQSPGKRQCWGSLRGSPEENSAARALQIQPLGRLLPYLWPLATAFPQWCWGSGKQGTPLGGRELSTAVLFPDIPTTGSEGPLPPPTPCPWADASPVLSAAEQLSGVCIIYLLCNIYWDLVFNNCHSNISFLNPFRSAAVAI